MTRKFGIKITEEVEVLLVIQKMVRKVNPLVTLDEDDIGPFIDCEDKIAIYLTRDGIKFESYTNISFHIPLCDPDALSEERILLAYGDIVERTFDDRRESEGEKHVLGV
jgi:hypothetical protein